MSSDAHAASHVHTGPSYMAIFWWLGGLTIGEIGVTFLPLGKAAIGVLLVGFALVKAALVAAYFMHLKFERRTLAVIAIVPLLICVFLVLMLVPDCTWSWRPN